MQMTEIEDTQVRDSILYSVKKQLGLEPDYKAFDNELILHINSVFAILHQMGVGPKKVFSISGSIEEWNDFSKDPRLDMVRTYMFMKVRLLFDPPSGATMFQAMNDQVDEYEFRLYVLGDESEGGDINDIYSGRHRTVSLRHPWDEMGYPQRSRPVREWI